MGNVEIMAKDDPKVCVFCKQTIVGTSVSLPNTDKFFHPKCFNCAKCKKPLGDAGYYEKDDKFYCQGCYTDQFMPKCAGCGKPLIGQLVKAFGKQYHKEC